MMTIEEFNKTGFCAGMSAMYKGNKYDVISVDFTESLVELELNYDESLWVRCENITVNN
jgi:hypothetical protein